MRIPFLTLLFIIILNAGADFYILRRIKSSSKKRLLPRIQLWSAIILLAGLLILLFLPVKETSDNFLLNLMWVIFAYMTIYLPKYLFVLFDCIASIPVLWKKHRLKWISKIGIGLGVITFCALWWGALFNRFNIDVKDVDVYVNNLPSGFENFKIVQISDLHVGTYGNDTTFLDKLVTKVNSLKPDLIVFTGDIVNRKASELKPFVDVLSRLRSRYGVYSILGNHDYGDYFEWDSEKSKELNNRELARLQKQMNWQLLANDYKIIRIKNDSIAVIGVENVGDPPFHTYGDLTKAYDNPNDSVSKILLSHNPSHWVKEIADKDINIGLTLSGHTHAMQATIFGWSPAVFRYRTWGGLYSDKTGKHQLYVNIGTGTVGFPARIGATPEVTVHTLHKKEQ